MFQVPAEFLQHLSEVEPLPHSEKLLAARKELERLRQRAGFVADVVNFAGRVDAMPAGLRSHSLDLLGRSLDVQKQQIIKELACDANHRYAFCHKCGICKAP